ncbi:hypothetical protein [Streptomyces sp. NPDC059757]
MFCRTSSLRQAATELHLHHSSVAARLAHVEEDGADLRIAVGSTTPPSC